MPKESLVKKFQQYLKAKGITPYRAERDLEMSNGSLGKIFDRDKGFKSTVLEKILSKYPDFDMGKMNSMAAANEEISPNPEDVQSRIANLEKAYKKLKIEMQFVLTRINISGSLDTDEMPDEADKIYKKMPLDPPKPESISNKSKTSE